MAKADPQYHRKRHPIQVVARRAGLTPDVLRAWEKRYGLVKPGRSEGGQRLYSDADIDRLRLLHQVTSAGRRVGHVAELDTEALAALVEEDRRARVTPREVPSEERPPSSAEVIEGCLAAVRELDGTRLEAILARTAVALTDSALVETVVAPLMHRVGQAWEDGELTPAHEHLATAVVLSALADLTSKLQPQGATGRLVVATLAGQRHEVGAMLAAAVAAAHGWATTYLGADLPHQDIATAAREAGANAVAVSLVYPAADPDAETELRALGAALGDEVSVIVGGRAAASYEAVLGEIGAVWSEDFGAFRRTLDALVARD